MMNEDLSFNVWNVLHAVEPEVTVLVLAGVINQITSPSESHNKISECQGSHSLPSSPIGYWVVVLMSEAEGLPWRRPQWYFKRTAHGVMKQSISNSKNQAGQGVEIQEGKKSV